MFKVFTQDMDIRDADNCSKCGMVNYGRIIDEKFVCVTCIHKNPNQQHQDMLFNDEFKEAYKERMRESTIYRGDENIIG